MLRVSGDDSDMIYDLINSFSGGPETDLIKIHKAGTTCILYGKAQNSDSQGPQDGLMRTPYDLFCLTLSTKSA
jgi:hypothetical protein